MQLFQGFHIFKIQMFMFLDVFVAPSLKYAHSWGDFQVSKLMCKKNRKSESTVHAMSAPRPRGTRPPIRENNKTRNRFLTGACPFIPIRLEGLAFLDFVFFRRKRFSLKNEFSWKSEFLFRNKTFSFAQTFTSKPPSCVKEMKLPATSALPFCNKAFVLLTNHFFRLLNSISLMPKLVTYNPCVAGRYFLLWPRKPLFSENDVCCKSLTNRNAKARKRKKCKNCELFLANTKAQKHENARTGNSFAKNAKRKNAKMQTKTKMRNRQNTKRQNKSAQKREKSKGKLL